ncbi:DUF3792 family protein [Acetobacteraceae bacterium]|nr:DUF3792 family protein [Acetobacteraceae bacterium]
MNIQYLETVIFIILFFLLMFLGGWTAAKRKGRRPWLWGTLCLFPLLFICLELSQSFDQNGEVKQEVTQNLSFLEYAALLCVFFFVGILFMMIFSLCSFFL